MVWTLENFPTEMEGLEIQIRIKAINIANELNISGEISTPYIVEVAINRAR